MAISRCPESLAAGVRTEGVVQLLRLPKFASRGGRGGASSFVPFCLRRFRRENISLSDANLDGAAFFPSPSSSRRALAAIGNHKVEIPEPPQPPPLQGSNGLIFSASSWESHKIAPRNQVAMPNRLLLKTVVEMPQVLNIPSLDLASRFKFRRDERRDVTQATVSPPIPHFHHFLDAARVTLNIDARPRPWSLHVRGKGKEKGGCLPPQPTTELLEGCTTIK